MCRIESDDEALFRGLKTLGCSRMWLTKDDIWTPFNKSYNCCILVNVIVESVVAPKGDQRAQAQTVREEDLSGCIKPHLREKKFTQLYACEHTSITVW